MSTFPDMLYHLGGVPVINYNGNKFITGTAFFVDSVNGNAGFTGLKPGEAITTLDAALGKCTASKGDVIYLMPGHLETITGAGGITIDKAGVSIIGLGTGSLRPTFLMDGANTVTALVTAADCYLENAIFKAGHADIAVCMTISAKNFHIKNCNFVENVAEENWVDIIHASGDNAYDGLIIEGCEFVMNDAACVTAIDLLKNSADVKILNNRILGDFDATPYAPIYSASTEVHKNILVKGNLIWNAHDGNAAVGIAIANVASTGWIVDNHVGHQDLADETPFLAGAAGLYVGQNYASGVLGTASGFIRPAVDS